MSADISTREGLFAVMRQIAAERETAKPLVAELLAREEIPWDEDIREEWKTVGFVEELTKAAADGVLNSGPEKHISLLQFTVAVLSTIPVQAYPPTVRAKAFGSLWTEIGWGHRYQASYAEALRAYSSARSAVERYGELEYEKNVLLYCESQVFGHMRELDRAINMLERARAVFSEFGDERRLIRCDIMKSAFMLWKGDLESSLKISAQLVAAIQNVEDVHTKGVIYFNFGLLNLRVGRLTEAQTAYEQARQIYSAAAMPVEIIRSNWGIASVRLERGDFAGALGKLNEIRSGFLHHQLVDDAGLTGLDIVEVLVATGRTDEARALAEDVLQEFRTANLNVRAIQAVAYLRDLMSGEKGARDAVRHVRAYIERMQRKETEVFLSPPDDPD